MRRRGLGRRIGLLTALAAMLAVMAPGPAQGASYKFKMDLSVLQETTDWEHEVRWPRDGFCGNRDVHYVYKGGGDGQLKLKVRGAKVTFTGNKTSLATKLFKVPGSVVTNHDGYTISRVGEPGDQCSDLRDPPSGFDALGSCSPLARRPGTAQASLYALRGRLTLFGAFQRKDKKTCADASLYSGLIAKAGQPKRKDVNTLLMNKRVRSIELSASLKTDPFGLKDLSDFGANTILQKASGKGNANWRVKLTRIK